MMDKIQMYGIQILPGIPTVRGVPKPFTPIIRSSSSQRHLLCLINIQRLLFTVTCYFYPPIERPIVMFPYLIHARKAACGLGESAGGWCNVRQPPKKIVESTYL